MSDIEIKAVSNEWLKNLLVNNEIGSLDISEDKVIQIDHQHAIETEQNLAKKEGVFCGIKAGASTFVAYKLKKSLVQVNECFQ